MVVKLRWDPAKAESNLLKHRVRFVEAETIFADDHIASIEDGEHSHDENRFLAIGESISRRLLVVCYTIRGDEAWLISARHAAPSERRRYMRGDRIRDKELEQLDLEDFPEVDFTNAVRGRHVFLKRGILRVTIDPDVARHYTTDEAVNEALRMLIAEGRAPEPRTE